MIRKIAITLVILQCVFIERVFAQTGLWTEVLPIDSPQAQSRGNNMPSMPSRFRLLTLDESLLTTTLSPLNVQRTTAPSAISLDLPLPNGKMVSVAIDESAVMPPTLAAKYPDINTYRVQGSIATVLSGRIDYTPLTETALGYISTKIST